MKTLSLKLDDHIFEETEEITSTMKLARNRYINEALKIFNLYNRKKILQQQLAQESKLVNKESMKILEEFEQFINEG
jgi:predicted transcriptional regulator